MDFSKVIGDIEKKIGYVFKDKALLKQAFTRTSYCNEQSQRGKSFQSNEVLEFFGDSVLSAAVATLLMQSNSKRYEHGLKTEWSEGDFSNIKSRLSDKKNLSSVTDRLGLQSYLLMGEGDVKLGIQNEPSVKEDLFESIIGAIYIDTNHSMNKVLEVVGRLLTLDEYRKSDTPPIQSYKNALQEWCASKAHKKDAPIYKTISESGPDHKKIYERGCYIGEVLYGVGKGKNQKLADTEAAKAALEALIAEDAKNGKNDDGASYPTRLREYAASHKKPSPIYRDLGESERSSSAKREYVIECKFDIYSARGVGNSKSEAKNEAVRIVLEQIKNENDRSKKTKSKKQKK